MDKNTRYSFLEIFRSFWPVLLFVFAAAVWAVQIQTTSQESFISLEIRVVRLEEQMPDKHIMREIHEKLAGMTIEIIELSTSIQRLERLLFKNMGGGGSTNNDQGS